jgi:hypothetical protein
VAVVGLEQPLAGAVGRDLLTTTSGRPMVKRSASQARCGLAMSLIASKSVAPRL